MLCSIALVQCFYGLVVNVAIKPFTFGTLVVIFTLKIIFVVVQTWMELMKTTITVNLSVLQKIVIWISAVVTLLLRLVTALQRERLLEEYLHIMQAELDNLTYNEEVLKEQLKTAIKERKAVETLLEEVEHETDEAIARNELLEGQVLKVENFQLKETLGKSHPTNKGHDDRARGENDNDVCYMVQSWEAKILGNDQGRLGNIENKPSNLKYGGSGLSEEECGLVTPGTSSRNLESREDLNKRRTIALSQSLFSALFSLFIRIIIWKAEDTCMPLVLALFTIVGMSLKSVVQFFFTINSKPALDAVALLCLNCFILGTLTYPTIPKLVLSESDQ